MKLSSQRRKNKGVKRILQDLWDTMKRNSIYTWEFQKEKRKDRKYNGCKLPKSLKRFMRPKDLKIDWKRIGLHWDTL